METRRAMARQPGVRPSRLLTRGSARALIGIGVLIAFVVGWEILAHTVGGSKSGRDDSRVPGWETIFGYSFKRMSDYWTGGFGVPVPSQGGKETYLGAFLALGASSLITAERVFGGLVLGATVGTLLGLAISASRWTRRLAAGPAHLLRMTPMLAAIPLFAVWFGATTEGMIIFVGYGVAVVLFVGVINAVGNIPHVYFERAQTIGASRLTTYRTVVLPAIFPELRSSVLLSLGLAWSLVLAAELLGAEKGLGVILLFAEQYAFTGRMMVIALLIVLYAGISFALFEVISRRIVAWQPRAAARSRPGGKV